MNIDNIKLEDIPKFVLGHEIINHREKISMLKDIIILLWEKVEEISSDKDLEYIKRKIHSDLVNFKINLDRDTENWLWDILFNESNKGEGNEKENR